jgi:hypothetical protein
MSETLAHWQAAWGLSVLFTRWDDIVGDTLAKLLAAMLLEQKVFLLGDIPRISTVALVLRALMWPFRWLHPYMSAPPPEGMLTWPLLDTPTPLVLSLTEVPAHWNYKTINHLPSDVVLGHLKHDMAKVHIDFETSGGLKGDKLKLPNAVSFRKQVAQAKRRHLGKEPKDRDIPKAVDIVIKAAKAGVQELAETIRRFVQQLILKSRNEWSSQAKIGMALAVWLHQEIPSRCGDLDMFMEWLESVGPADSSNDLACFYKTFFQTQLCMEFMREQIEVQIDALDAQAA